MIQEYNRHPQIYFITDLIFFERHNYNFEIQREFPERKIFNKEN